MRCGQKDVEIRSQTALVASLFRLLGRPVGSGVPCTCREYAETVNRIRDQGQEYAEALDRLRDQGRRR